MVTLIKTAEKVQEFLESRNWQFCFIGGLALQRWGEERLTQSVDLTLFTGFGNEEVFIDELTDNFESRLEDAKKFGVRNRVLLLQSGNIGIYISLGALPFEESVIERASLHEYLPKVLLKTCSAEDLILLKAFADRTRDWADIESIVQKQMSLDWNYISEQLTPLVELKAAPEILVKLNDAREKYY